MNVGAVVNKLAVAVSHAYRWSHRALEVRARCRKVVMKEVAR